MTKAEGCHICVVEGIVDDGQTEEVEIPIEPDQFAYVIFTSGSTGQPKGVIQSHRTALNNARNYINGIFLSPEDRYCVLASFSFTASFSGVFGPLLSGGGVFLFDLKQYGFNRLIRWLKDERISVYHSIPSIFRTMCGLIADEEKLFSLRLVKLGGEPTTLADVEDYRRCLPDDCILHIGLGASEINIIRQYFLNKSSTLTGNRVPVGYPVPNVDITIVDDAGHPVKTGVEGEILIQSRYLTPGYWKDEDATRRSFVDVPGSDGVRAFRTGDLGRMEPDGCLVHLGRNDFQVKINGQRVELEEIEVALLRLPIVKEAVVAARTDSKGGSQLVAYVVSNKEAKDLTPELRDALNQRLPGYMVPNAFVFLESLPLTSTGKVDRRALPYPHR
jgi:acyl-coenzyme A synthetase/AMP-(fatty) acid ligase